MRRVGVVEHGFDTAGKSRDFAERGEDRVLGQLGRDAEPEHEGAPFRAGAARLERLGQASVGKIVADIADMRRLGDQRLRQTAALVAPRRGMVELEGAQAVDRRESIGEGVGAGARPAPCISRGWTAEAQPPMQVATFLGVQTSRPV